MSSKSVLTNAIDPRLIQSIFGGRPTLARFISVSEAIYATRASNYALLTLLVWDMIITFPREIEVVWKSKWTVVKVLFLLNRYVTPWFMAAHIWALSGRAVGLSDKSCRIIYSFSTIAEITCISFVSLVTVMRLYTLFEVSHRTLYILLVLWLATFMAAAALLIPNVWGPIEQIIYIKSLNFCSISALSSPSAWTLWIPRATEHGLLFVFLIVNAMGTPRKSQTNVVAVLYRQGIVYNAMTFILFLGILLFWRYGNRLYIPLTAYSIGLILTLVTSRFFLAINAPTVSSLRYSHARTPFKQDVDPRDGAPFTYPSSTVGDWIRSRISPPGNFRQNYNRDPGNFPSNLPPPPSPTATTRTYEPSEMARTISIDEIDAASQTTREAHMVSVHWTFIRRRAWWLVGDQYHVSTENLSGTIEGERIGQGASAAEGRGTRGTRDGESRSDRFTYWV